MRKLMNGNYHPYAPRSGAGYVDIEDVAAAHTLAMLTPQASGRPALDPFSLCAVRLKPMRSVRHTPARRQAAHAMLALHASELQGSIVLTESFAPCVAGT